jgi:predicted dehydrogenase
MSKIRTCIIGCGAAAEHLHLPALQNMEEISIDLLVDKNISRASELAGIYHVHNYLDKFEDFNGEIDMAIVAAPNHMHAEIVCTLLNEGVHVLLEKPMALSSEECRRMIHCARINGVKLGIGFVRRYYDTSVLIKNIIDKSILGEKLHLEIVEGKIFNWETASDYLFKKETGGGVLYDIGSHVLDLASWWLGPLQVINYEDDSLGGVEANSVIHCTGKENSTILIELSRTRDLQNTIKLIGAEGQLITGVRYDDPVSMKLKTLKNELHFSETTKRHFSRGILDIFEEQITRFIDAIENDRSPLITGADGLHNIVLIEQCFSMRNHLKYPWEHLTNRMVAM